MNNNFAFIALTLLFLGCSQEKSTPRAGWYHSAEATGALQAGKNFYKTYPERHPHYGLVVHSIDESRYTPAVENRSITTALKECREVFSDSFRKGVMRAPRPNTDENLKDGEDSSYMKFDPKWIVIVIRNRHDFDKDDQLSSAQKMTKTGYIVSASDLLGSSKSIEDIVAGAFRDPAPLDFDLTVEPPRDQTKYRIIERFEESKSKKTGKSE